MARSKNELRKAKQLPSWFNLDKYDDSANLDAAGWYEQLAIRRDCITMMGSARWNQWEKDGPSKLGEHFIEALRMIRETPIADASSNELLRVYFFDGALYDIKGDEKPHYSLAVHSMTVRQLKQVERSMSEGRRKYAERFWKQLDDFDLTIKNGIRYPCKGWIDSPVHESGEMKKCFYSLAPDRWRIFEKSYRIRHSITPVMVNLDLPDSILLDSFKQWLADARQNIQPESTDKKYRKPDFASWAQMGILPWLDLTIWAKQEGVSIPNRVMADAIFKPGEGGEEVVRKTTEPTALRMIGKGKWQGMNPFYALAAQAAHEKAERYGRQ